VPTQTTFGITHGTRSMVVRSDVDLYLTPEYARSRGFSVQELRRKKLIREKHQIAREPRPDIDDARKTRSQRAWESGQRSVRVSDVERAGAEATPADGQRQGRSGARRGETKTD
jgi:hypothetical protein